MEKKWSNLSSDEKREERFKKWLSPTGIDFINHEAERLYKERVTRIIDAIKLKEPDRVPVVLNPGHLPAMYSGYTIREVMYDTDKLTKAWHVNCEPKSVLNISQVFCRNNLLSASTQKSDPKLTLSSQSKT